MCCIRPEHKCDNYSWQIAIRLWGRALEGVVCLTKSFGSIDFAMQSDLPMLIRPLPKEVIRHQMKSGSSMWVRNPLFYHLYQRPMIEFSANKLAGTGTLHSAVEWHCYLHLFLPPPSIHIQPFLTSLVIWTTASERGENLAPFCRADIIWIE